MGTVIVDRYLAAGGPKDAFKSGDGFEKGPTDAGTYVIAYYDQHTSARYATWSTIRWGTPLRETEDGRVEVYDGTWRALESYKKAPSVDEIKIYNRDLYGEYEVPKKWVFNDFGHLTCYYFKDLNKNRKLDGKERLSEEFIHTTPQNEAQTALGKDVQLVSSHGCIHVAPRNIDDMKAKGYLNRGTTLVVHDYDAKAPLASLISKGRAPFEVHFYPGPHFIVVYGQGIH